MNSIRSHMARTSLMYAVSLVTLTLRSIVLIPLLLRSLGVNGYGSYVLALALVTYGIVFVKAGLDSSLYQYMTPVIKAREAVVLFWTAIISVTLWALVVFVVSVVAANFVQNDAIRAVVPLCLLSSGAQALWGLSLAPFRCEERSGVYSGIATGAALGEFAVTATVAALTRSLFYSVAAIALYHMVIAVVVLSVQGHRYRPMWWQRDAFVKLFKFGLYGLYNQLLITGYFVWDRTILSLTSGISAVAAYSPGIALGTATLPLAGMSSFTIPTLMASKEAQRSVTLRQTILRAAIRQYALLAVPAVAGIQVIAGPFLRIITSPALAIVGAPVARIAVVAILVNGLGQLAVSALRAEGDDAWLSRNLTINSMLFLSLSIGGAILWPAHAALAIALAILAANVSQTVTLYIRLNRHTPNVLAPSLFLTPMAGTFAFLCLSPLVPHDRAGTLVLFIFASILVYCLVGMAVERVGPSALWQMFRNARFSQETFSQETSLSDANSSSGADDRENVIIYAAPNHLFCSSGILYAAELSEVYTVHVVLNEYHSSAVSPVMLSAMAERGMIVHWLPDKRGLAKHEMMHHFAKNLIDALSPACVFLDSDMGAFNVVLARWARRFGAEVVCYQTGVFGENLRDDYDFIINSFGTAWAEERRLPAFVGKLVMVLRQRAYHYWNYYIGPVLAGYSPFLGRSSIFLRWGHTGQRDGQAYLCYEPGGPAKAIEAGTPPHSVVPIGHPLLRHAGRALNAEIFPRPPGVGDQAALLLVGLPSDPAISGPTAMAAVIEAAAGLAGALAQHWDQVFVKPHPGLVRFPKFLEALGSEMSKIKQARIVDPQTDAMAYLPYVRVVVGEISTIIKVARYYSELIIISTSFADRPYRVFHASTAGLNIFPTWRDVVASDLGKLKPSESASVLPDGASNVTIVEALRQRGFLCRHNEA